MRLVLRQLWKNPGFALVAVATLALCLGANLTIMAVVDAILVRALPFKEPDRLAVMFNSYPGAGAERVSGSLPNYFDRRGAVSAFQSVSAYQEASVIVGGVGEARRVPTLRISPEFFTTLGVPLAMGRSFTEENLAYRADEVAVLTDGFWRSHFAADPQVIGRTFDNDGARTQVVGVLPPGFRFLSSKAQFFRPASHAPEDRLPLNRHSGDWNLIARLAPGVTLGEAQAQMQVFNAQLAKDDPAAELLAKTGFHTRVESLHADHVKPVRRTLVLLQVGVMFLLLIGVANLANLLLIRASGQASEIAVRQALGAGRGSVIRRVSAEILALVVLAGIAGTLLGLGGLRLLTRLGANQLPLGEEIRFDARLALAAAGTMAVVGIVLATLVTVFHLRVRLAQGLRIISRGGTPGRATRRVHHGFVVAQVALAFVLLCGAGMLATSLRRVLRMPAGFEPSHILTGRIVYPWSGYTNQASRLAFVDRLVESVRVLPGVTQVAVTDSLPFSRGVDDYAIEVEGHAPTTGSSVVAHQLSLVTPDYWRAMGIPLMRGRLLEEADRHREPRACVVDQAFADRYWPGGDPLGHRLTVGAQFDPQDAVTIVGVVAAVKQADLTEPSGKGAVYQPYGRRWPESFTLVVRTAAAPEAMAPMVRQAVARCDPGMPWDDVRSMPSRIEASLVARRSPTVLAGVFAAVALFLSALGTYGVLAYAVGERRREIGVRMALGAQTGQVAAQFFGLGVKLCLMGLGLGVLGSVVAGRAMASVLYGMEGPPAGVIGAAGVALLLVMVLASLVPSRRAARLDPMEALRAD